MSQENAKTIDTLCEVVFDAAAKFDPRYMVRFSAEIDPATRLAYFSMAIAERTLPRDLLELITPHVERQVVAFFHDLQVVVKVEDDPEWGRCLYVHLPPELRGTSWNSFIGRSLPMKK